MFRSPNTFQTTFESSQFSICYLQCLTLYLYFTVLCVVVVTNSAINLVWFDIGDA